jgi:hypothetical protein
MFPKYDNKDMNNKKENDEWYSVWTKYSGVQSRRMKKQSHRCNRICTNNKAETTLPSRKYNKLKSQW